MRSKSHQLQKMLSPYFAPILSGSFHLTEGSNLTKTCGGGKFRRIILLTCRQSLASSIPAPMGRGGNFVESTTTVPVLLPIHQVQNLLFETVHRAGSIESNRIESNRVERSGRMVQKVCPFFSFILGQPIDGLLGSSSKQHKWYRGDFALKFSAV